MAVWIEHGSPTKAWLVMKMQLMCKWLCVWMLQDWYQAVRI